MEFVEIPSADESEDSEYENDNDFETSVRDVDESQVDESIDQAYDSPKNASSNANSNFIQYESDDDTPLSVRLVDLDGI